MGLFVNALYIESCVLGATFFLNFGCNSVIMTTVMKARLREQGYYLRGKMMKRFYERFWCPFVVTKRRILILAIASYIALC